MITTSSTTRRNCRRLALACGAALALVACGGSDDAEPAATAATAQAAESAESAAATGGAVTTGSTSEGDVLTDAAGLSLYGFTPDAGGTPTCVDGCAQAWPPFTVEGDALPDGLDPAVFSVVTHPDGSSQLAAGGWPLYYFAGDAAAGDVNGQGSGGNWFLAAPDGSLIGAPADAMGDDAMEEEAAEALSQGY